MSLRGTSSVGSDSFSKGKGVSGTSSTDVSQLTQDVSDISFTTGEDAGWEVYGKKNKNKGASGAVKQWPQQSSSSRAWGNPGSGRGGSGTNWPSLGPHSGRPAGRGLPQPLGLPQSLNPPSHGNQHAAAAPPLKHGWNWASRPGAAQQSGPGSANSQVTSTANAPIYKESVKEVGEVDESDDSDVDDYEFDDDLFSDEFDSDSSVKSHETRKKTRHLKELFDCMDGLTAAEINDPERQWHCPACYGGPGAIDWYRGLQPLVAHAKTKGNTRVKLHRELAQLLEEELRRRGTAAVPAGETFGHWRGLDRRADRDIVWPPMVVIMNTRLDKDENDKWIGMGNQELLDYFSSFAALKARHSYGPQGHRGISLLIFESSAVGYLEAERLCKHFEDESRDRDAWERNRAPFYPGGKRQLYGYMAEKRDIDSFNQHCQGKSKLKFELVSYQQHVVQQLKQMSEDNQQLLWLKNKVANEQIRSGKLQDAVDLYKEKLRETAEERRFIKLKTKMHHEQNKEEMDYQEQFFKEQLKTIFDARNAQEDSFEKVQQEQWEKITQTPANPSSVQDPRARAEEIAKSIKLQDKEMEDFVAQRDMLINLHEQRMQALQKKHLKEEMDLKGRHYEEVLAIEKEFDAAQVKLMEKYKPSSSSQ
ncbi:OLC1v1008537C1 [Oldenlandia corymbosa var. corymbosa]|uniref:OLC1v1008537C1 n=1 Tax=Oldenlandia corymbosa var. corymbosa TaxID=529605 RepID=A0AAV1DPM9_OLDCO|nr:OLC1v1008537C1 [Oldenlandia corymbosa var. corymbosa]